MELKEIIKSRLYIVIILSLAAILFLVLTFGVGMYVGFHKARFSYQWGENYHKNFGGPRGGFLEGFGGKDLIDANGIAGQVIKINNSTLVIKGRDNTEKIILVKEDTIIMRFKESVKLVDIKLDDFIVAIGEPNDQGQIEAKFIRTLPPMPTSTMPFIPPMRGMK